MDRRGIDNVGIIGEFADDATALNYIRAQHLDTNLDGTGNPWEGMIYYNNTNNVRRVYLNGAWENILSGTFTYHYEADGLDNTLVTILPAGTVGAILEYDFVIEEVGGGVVAKAMGSVLPGAGAVLYDDTVDVLTLTVTAGGAIQIQRTAGADTFDVTGGVKWR